MAKDLEQTSKRGKDVSRQTNTNAKTVAQCVSVKQSDINGFSVALVIISDDALLHVDAGYCGTHCLPAIPFLHTREERAALKVMQTLRAELDVDFDVTFYFRKWQMMLLEAAQTVADHCELGYQIHNVNNLGVIKLGGGHFQLVLGVEKYSLQGTEGIPSSARWWKNNLNPSLSNDPTPIGQWQWNWIHNLGGITGLKSLMAQ